MKSTILQVQYEKIHSYFKTTTEPFDFLERNGNVLNVWFQDTVVEKYGYADLSELIEGFHSSKLLKSGRFRVVEK